jgi:LacI family transcriptional regulator
MGDQAGGSRTVTLKDLARELGVHPSTVSRVLHSGSDVAKGAASTATAERVRELAKRLGYSRDPQAASLRTRRTKLLGVIVPRLSDLVLAIMYEGIDQAAAEVGYSAFVMNSRDDPEEQGRKIDLMLARRVDGLIIGDAHLDGSLLQELTAKRVPFVLMNRRVPGYPSATCDDVVGGELVAEHLWDKGHRKVSVIAGEPYASTAVDRTAGFLDRWRSLGGTISADDVVWSRFDTAGGREAAEQVLTSGRPCPTAIFAVNDFAAIGAMGALRSRGLTVGQDVAVVGYNDTSLAAELPIPLTSVHSPMLDIGRAAVQLIQGVLNGEKPEPERLKPTLRVRESSAAHAPAEVCAN